MRVPRTLSRDRERQGSCLIGSARFGQDTRRLHPRAAVRVAARREHGGRRDRDRILGPPGFGQHLSRPQPGLQRRHVGEGVLWPVGGGQQTVRNMLRRFEVTGTDQGEQQVICRPRVIACHAQY